MDIVFSDDFLKQLEIIETASDNGNIDFKVLYARIGVAIKSLSEISSIDDIPFKLRYHEGNDKEIGHLGYPLDDCLSLDIDRSNRFLTFELLNNAVIITSLGHYNVLCGRDSHGSKSWLFETPEDQVNYIKYCSAKNDQSFKQLKIRTQPAIDSLLKNFNEVQIDSDLINQFNATMAYDLCPIGVDSIKIRLSSFLEDNDSIFRRPNGSFDSKQRDQSISRFLKDNALLMERATLNARCLSNSVAKVKGDGDLKNTLFIKLDLDKKLIRDFTDLLYLCNGKIQNLSLKKDIFDFCSQTFLKGFDSKYDHIIEFKNAPLGTFDYRDDYEIIRRLDERLRNTLCNDLNLCASCDKKEFFRIISKNNSEQLFSLFLPETNKNLVLFRKNCRRLNLNKLGKVRENHELICKRLGLKSGDILKNKYKIVVEEDLTLKKGIKR